MNWRANQWRRNKCISKRCKLAFVMLSCEISGRTIYHEYASPGDAVINRRRGNGSEIHSTFSHYHVLEMVFSYSQSENGNFLLFHSLSFSLRCSAKERWCKVLHSYTAQSILFSFAPIVASLACAIVSSSSPFEVAYFVQFSLSILPALVFMRGIFFFLPASSAACILACLRTASVLVSFTQKFVSHSVSRWWGILLFQRFFYVRQ